MVYVHQLVEARRKGDAGWAGAYHRVLTPTSTFSSRRSEYEQVKDPLLPQWDKRAIKPNHINNMTSSSLAMM
jgi:hypothetical protein